METDVEIEENTCASTFHDGAVQQWSHVTSAMLVPGNWLLFSEDATGEVNEGALVLAVRRHKIKT